MFILDHWKACEGFLLVMIELFSLGITAEALQADIDRKPPILKRRGCSKISSRMGRPLSTIIPVKK